MGAERFARLFNALVEDAKAAGLLASMAANLKRWLGMTAPAVEGGGLRKPSSRILIGPENCPGTARYT